MTNEIFRVLRILVTLLPYILMPTFTFVLALHEATAWGWFLFCTVILLGNLKFTENPEKEEPNVQTTFI